MQQLHATQTTSISELKKNPTEIIRQAAGKPVAILNHNIASAYLIPTELYEKLMELVDDRALEELINKRLTDGTTAIKVSLDEL